jgi:hypothetical protein
MLSRVRVLAALLPLTLALGGCLFESTIDAKGGAEVKLHYRIAPNTKIEKVARDLESADVKLVSKSLDKDGWMDATVKTDDVTKLPTTAFFKAWTITLVDGKDKGTKKLTAHFVNKTPNVKVPQSGLDYYGNEIKIVVNLPGEIVSANAPGGAKGTAATWTYESEEFFKSKEQTIEVTYKLPK